MSFFLVAKLSMLISVRLILEMWLFDINRLTHYWFYFILADKTIFTVTIGSYTVLSLFVTFYGQERV